MLSKCGIAWTTPEPRMGGGSPDPSEPRRERGEELAGPAPRALRRAVVLVCQVLTREVQAQPMAPPPPRVANQRVYQGVGLMGGVGGVGEESLVADEIEAAAHVEAPSPTPREVVAGPEVEEMRGAHLQRGVVVPQHVLVIRLPGGIEGCG